MWHQWFIFQIFWKIMKEKDWSDTQPDSTIQPKAQGLLHMEREYFAHYIWSRFWGLSTSQPQSNQKYMEDYSTYLKEGPEATRRMFWLLEVHEDTRPSTRCLQDSATKSSRAYCWQPNLAGQRSTGLTGLPSSNTIRSCFIYGIFM